MKSELDKCSAIITVICYDKYLVSNNVMINILFFSDLKNNSFFSRENDFAFEIMIESIDSPAGGDIFYKINAEILKTFRQGKYILSVFLHLRVNKI